MHDKLTIGFDAKRLFFNRTGLGNFSRTLVSELAKNAPSNAYMLYSPKADAEFDDERYHQPPFHVRYAPTPILSSYWRTYQLGRAAQKDSCQVFHGLSNELPMDILRSGVRSIVTIHDVIFLRFPHFYPTLERRIYRQKTIQACKHADQIIAISQRTADDLVDLLNVPAQKIEVIYQGCDDRFGTPRDASTEKTLLDMLALKRPFILSVGTIEARKNQLSLLKAFVHSKSYIDHDLVLVGKHTPYFKTLDSYLNEHPEAKRSIVMLTDLSNSDLPTLLRAATLMVYPSKYEGFGLPVLEAQKAGVPVIAASGSCLEETGGDAARYFKPDDPMELSSLLSQLLSRKGDLAEMRAKGLVQSTKFSNQRMAEQYLEHYQRLANKTGKL